MEDVKEIEHEMLKKESAEQITEQNQTVEIEGNQLQEKNLQQQKSQEQEEIKKNEIPGEKQQQQKQTIHQQPQKFDYEQDGDDDDEDYEDDDDDEEKETSQKLVIDIPEEEEEDEKEEEDDDDDIIAISDLPPQVGPLKKETEKIFSKPEKIEAVITLSDGEEDVTNDDGVITKPGKVQKRRSMGAGTENEDHLRLKRRKINVAGAPKLPLTGYLRYLNDRREAVRKQHPSKTHTEHNKMIGEEWHALPADVKNRYLKAADIEKQRYVKELQSFLKSRPDILASELAKNKIRKTAENNSPNPATVSSSSGSTKSVLKDKLQINDSSKATKDNNLKDKICKEIVSIASASQQASSDKTNSEKGKRKRTPTPPSSNNNNNNNNNNSTTSSTALPAASTSSSTTSAFVNPTPGEIPIFTNDFLEHNKIYDMELRSIRKSKTDLEQQNSVLEKHVENMKFGVDKMRTENNELEEKNRLLEIYLDKLKRKLALALSALPLPTAPNGATVDNIDKYMQDLYKMSTSNSTGPATLNKAKDIIRKLDLQIQL